MSGLCRTHSDAERTCPAVGLTQFTPPHQTRQDCRACLSTAARQAATPSRPTAHTQRRCTPRKMYTRCGLLHTCKPKLFTKRHVTRVIYRLTVQTLPDGLETQLTPPDTTQTVLSCRVWRAVCIKHYTQKSTLYLGFTSPITSYTEY